MKPLTPHFKLQTWQEAEKKSSPIIILRSRQKGPNKGGRTDPGPAAPAKGTLSPPREALAGLSPPSSPSPREQLLQETTRFSGKRRPAETLTPPRASARYFPTGPGAPPPPQRPAPLPRRRAGRRAGRAARAPRPQRPTRRTAGGRLPPLLGRPRAPSPAPSARAGRPHRFTPPPRSRRGAG